MHESIIVPLETITQRVHDEFGNGEIVVKECPCCGYCSHLSTDPSKPNKVIFAVRDLSDGCPECQRIMDSNPQLFDWILNVVTKAQKDVKNGKG